MEEWTLQPSGGLVMEKEFGPDPTSLQPTLQCSGLTDWV